MADQLRRKAGAEAIELTIGDMTSARIDGAFRLVYLVFNTIMNVTTQDEQVAVFANAAAHLELDLMARLAGLQMRDRWAVPRRAQRQSATARSMASSIARRPAGGGGWDRSPSSIPMSAAMSAHRWNDRPVASSANCV